MHLEILNTFGLVLPSPVQELSISCVLPSETDVSGVFPGQGYNVGGAFGLHTWNMGLAPEGRGLGPEAWDLGPLACRAWGRPVPGGRRVCRSRRLRVDVHRSVRRRVCLCVYRVSLLIMQVCHAA